jgi:hypothetical protein
MNNLDLIIDDECITEDEKLFIDTNLFIYRTLPLYSNYATRQYFKYFAHILVLRDHAEDASPNSDWLPFFETIFRRFAFKHNLQVNKIWRAAINVTHENSQHKYVDPHVDQPFDHKIFILYLNIHDLIDTDMYSHTLIFDKKYSDNETNTPLIEYNQGKDLKLLHSIAPKFGKGICFNGDYYHTACFPHPMEYRYVAVFNFS